MTWLAHMRQTRLCRLVIFCIPLLMVLTPAAHRLAMALSGNAPGHALVAGDGLPAVLDKALILNEAPAMLGETAVPLEAHHHADLCCGAGEPSKAGDSPHAACVVACCPAVISADRHHGGGAIAAETDLVLSIPPSVSRDGIHPPPRRQSMS